MKQKITKQNLYKRQTTLKEIGNTGQEKLQQAKILVIGCGGLGCVASVYLAASGIGKLHLVDFDIIDQSNLHRQVFYTLKDIHKPKSQVLANYITRISPFVEVSFDSDAIVKDTLFQLIDQYDIILDCTDSLPIKYLINDACVIKNKVLVYGSLYKFDGYVATFNHLENNTRTCNLRDAFSKIPKETVPNCSEVGTLNTIVGMIGLLQANEVLKLITNTGNPLVNQILIYNSLENSQYKMKLKKVFSKEMILEEFNKETYQNINCEIQDSNLLITINKLKKKINEVTIISVIEDISTKLPFNVAVKIPLSKLNLDNLNLAISKEYVVICNKGISSYKATKIIKEKYPNVKIYSLKDGVNEL
ncbi:MAG: HesA/MoeB/ThiF family protein [Flavobacteriaceae bacterium]|nr:HesA/MoeB/ThiF family protein [Flavobacteriaceae bacterium]